MAFSLGAELAIRAVSMWLLIEGTEHLVNTITGATPNECSLKSVHGAGKCVELGLATMSLASETALGKIPMVKGISNAATVFVDVLGKVATMQHFALNNMKENVNESAKIVQPWLDEAVNWYVKREAEKVFEVVHKEEAARIVIEWMTIERTDAEWIAEFTKVAEVARIQEAEITRQNAEAERQRAEAEAERQRAEAEVERQRVEAEAERQRAEAERQRVEAEAERQRQEQIRRHIAIVNAVTRPITTTPWQGREFQGVTTTPWQGREFQGVTTYPVPFPTNLQPFNLPPL